MDKDHPEDKALQVGKDHQEALATQEEECRQEEEDMVLLDEDLLEDHLEDRLDKDHQVDHLLAHQEETQVVLRPRIRPLTHRQMDTHLDNLPITQVLLTISNHRGMEDHRILDTDRPHHMEEITLHTSYSAATMLAEWWTLIISLHPTTGRSGSVRPFERNLTKHLPMLVLSKVSRSTLRSPTEDKTVAQSSQTGSSRCCAGCALID